MGYKQTKEHIERRINSEEYILSRKRLVPWNRGKKGLQKDVKKGLSYDEYYGKERAKEIKGKIGIKSLNRKFTDNRNNKISNAQKGNTHGFKKGLIPWSKGLTKETSGKLRDSIKKREITLQKNPEIIKKMAKKSSITKRKLFESGVLKSHRKGKSHTKESIEKIKVARARQSKTVMPSTEIKIQGFLKEIGMEFFTHQYIREINHPYQCDILIPSMNLVIECDGDYWHKYPIGTDIDHIRTKELLEKGFKVLRLWECEIKVMELNEFKQKIMHKTNCTII